MRKLILSLLSLVLMLSACVKNETLRRFTIYRPVYVTKAEVREGVAFQKPQTIDKLGNIIVYKNYLLATELDKGIHVIDAQNAGAMKKIAFIPIPGNHGLAIRNDVLYANCYDDLFAVDIADVNQLKLVGVTENVFQSLNTIGGYSTNGDLVIKDWQAIDTMVKQDFIDGYSMLHSSNPLLLSSAPVTNASFNGSQVSTGGSMARFTIVNQYLYAVDRFSLSTFDLSIGNAPHRTDSTMVNWNVETIYPFQNNLFIGSQTGMFIYSLATPSHPSYRSQFNHANVCDPVIANENHAFVTLRSGTQCQGITNQLDVLDIADLNHPTLVKTYPMSNPHGLGMQNHTLFLCDGEKGLRVFDATDVNNITETRRFEIGWATDAIVLPSRAYILTKESIYVYDYQSAKEVSYVGHIQKR